jgi:hypothetical protein
MEIPEKKRKVRYLNVEADEDHVSLQDGTDTMSHSRFSGHCFVSIA